MSKNEKAYLFGLRKVKKRIQERLASLARKAVEVVNHNKNRGRALCQLSRSQGRNDKIEVLLVAEPRGPAPLSRAYDF